MKKKYSLTFPQQNIWLVNSLYNNSKVNLITGIININKGTVGIIKQTIATASELINTEKFALYFRNKSENG